MTKAELFNYLMTKFHTVTTPEGKKALLLAEDTPKRAIREEIRSAENINWYTIGVYEKKNDTLIRKNISFYVENEGTEQEVAYWHDQTPPPIDKPVDTITPALKSYIDELVNSGQLVGVLNFQINPIQKNALLTAVVEENDQKVKREVYVQLDESNKGSHDILSS